MDLAWVWYGFLVIVCMFLMLGVMWLTDEGLEWLKKQWNKKFNSLEVFK